MKNYAEVKKALDERGSSSYVTGENPPATPRLSVVNAGNNIAENAAGVNRGAVTPAEIIDNGLKRIAADDAINGEAAKANAISAASLCRVCANFLLSPVYFSVAVRENFAKRRKRPVFSAVSFRSVVLFG